MTKIISLFTLTLIIVLASCASQKSESKISFYSDTAIFKIDTSINNISIDGKPFSVKVLRDNFNEHLERFLDDNNNPTFIQSPITLVFTSQANNKIVYIKKFDFDPNDYPNLSYSFYKANTKDLTREGKLYLVLNKGYGGSGSQSTRYYINFQDNKVNFSNLFNSNGELSYILYNKNDNEIIVLNGVWNMKENESHFANHRYIITKYTFINNSFEKKEIGLTKFKYASLDEAKPILQILTDIQTKEPILFKELDVLNLK